MPGVKVRVAGSGGVMGSTQKDAISADLLIQEFMRMHGAPEATFANICKNNDKSKHPWFGWSCSEDSGALTEAERAAIPSVSLLQFSFQTGRAIILTAGVTDGVCAPFRSDLNKTFALTDPAAIYEYQCHLWESRAADRGISIHDHFCVGTNYFTLNIFVLPPPRSSNREGSSGPSLVLWSPKTVINI